MAGLLGDRVGGVIRYGMDNAQQEVDVGILGQAPHAPPAVQISDPLQRLPQPINLRVQSEDGGRGGRRDVGGDVVPFQVVPLPDGGDGVVRFEERPGVSGRNSSRPPKAPRLARVSRRGKGSQIFHYAARSL